ncbi:hypothetical protein [Inconstantimicrobium mannanitabidum]|uniref:Uncharacterized protein n=1 Tax=Inconstantimicrobium mannanitabidum TaxID=1604901 RepID=A0ACB5R8Z6_9CLOT|nr:hypothetical protein [Clostridium sp. TW13]GKX65607.1 hypothetical protein rsdtw13_08650 [Clostridium sp. TW13]
MENQKQLSEKDRKFLERLAENAYESEILEADELEVALKIIENLNGINVFRATAILNVCIKLCKFKNCRSKSN